jgi:hypothetical protein
MEWPSARIDVWVIGLVLLGVGAFAISDRYTNHQMTVAVSCWVAAVLMLVCGFPAV